MNVHGACHCGAVAYEATVDPDRVVICHCTDCQNLTGTAYRVTVPTRVDDFRLQQGVPKIYFKVGGSGRRRAQTFCGDCGSHLYSYTADVPPLTFGLRVGCIRERRELTPRKRIWCRSALEWSLDLHAMDARPEE
ncbi:MAG: GFA family protein [Casimicrobiaceae bacterium]